MKFQSSHKPRSVEPPFDAFMLALLALALPVVGYVLSGFGGLAVGLVLAVMVQDSVPHRFGAWLERQPRWREYVATVVIVWAVGAIAGRSTKAITDHAAFVIFLLGANDTIKWLSDLRKRSQLSVKP